MKKDVIANGLNGVWWVFIIVGVALGSAYMEKTASWQHILICLSAGLTSFLPQWGFNQYQPEGHQTARSVDIEVKTSWLWGGIAGTAFAVTVAFFTINNWTPVWITGIVLAVLAIVLHGGIFRIFKK